METTPTSFYFPYAVNLFLGSAKRKADTNLAVIELVKEIEKEGRFATPDEQELISHYVGYGDSSVLSARYSDVVEAVTNEEFAALRASTLNAHYTSLPIIRGIWAGLLRMGAGKLSQNLPLQALYVAFHQGVGQVNRAPRCRLRLGGRGINEGKVQSFQTTDTNQVTRELAGRRFRFHQALDTGARNLQLGHGVLAPACGQIDGDLLEHQGRHEHAQACGGHH